MVRRARTRDKTGKSCITITTWRNDFIAGDDGKFRAYEATILSKTLDSCASSFPPVFSKAIGALKARTLSRRRSANRADSSLPANGYRRTHRRSWHMWTGKSQPPEKDSRRGFILVEVRSSSLHLPSPGVYVYSSHACRSVELAHCAFKLKASGTMI